MHKRKFTVFTQLHEKNNADLIEYVDDRRKRYAKPMRETFHLIKNTDKFNKTSHNTYLQNKYGITKRTAGSIISDAQGRLNALKEFKIYEKRQLEQKIEHLEKKVLPKLISKRNNCIAQLKANPPDITIDNMFNRNTRKLSIFDNIAQLNYLINNIDEVFDRITELDPLYLVDAHYKQFSIDIDCDSRFPDKFRAVIDNCVDPRVCYEVTIQWVDTSNVKENQ